MEGTTNHRRIIHNCHVHLFNIDHIPRKFLNRFFTVPLMKKERVAKACYWALRKWFHRYAAFFYSAMKIAPEAILKELTTYYPEKTRFVPLTIDFDYMEAGSPLRPFEKQLEDMADLKQKAPELIFPFIGVDPRRPKVLKLVQEYIERRGFCGIKLYPGLGFFPNDERLHDVYAYAEEYAIPITSHCLPKNKNHYRGKLTIAQLEQAQEVPGFDIKETRKNYDFAQYFNHPFWYGRVLETFPNIKINLAHFGGDKEWCKYLDDYYEEDRRAQNWYLLIRDLMRAHTNVYADISFTVFDCRLYPVLKNLMHSPKIKDRVLFGSDFYMLQKDYRERRFGLDVRGYLDDEHYWQVAETNPIRFLSSHFHDFTFETIVEKDWQPVEPVWSDLRAN